MRGTKGVLRVVHTADLTPAERDRLHAFLIDAFDNDFADTDWEHSLGGIHAFVVDNDRQPIAHASVVARTMIHSTRTLRVGYVEAVAVRADHRREGLGGAVMAEMERIIVGGYDLGALASSDEGVRLYESRGWVEWAGPLAAYGAAGRIDLPTDDRPHLFAVDTTPPLDSAAELLLDWRCGDIL